MLLDKEITSGLVKGFISIIKDFIVEAVTAPFKYIQSKIQ